MSIKGLTHEFKRAGTHFLTESKVCPPVSIQKTTPLKAVLFQSVVKPCTRGRNVNEWPGVKCKGVTQPAKRREGGI